MALSTFTMMCNHHYHSSPELFFNLSNQKLCPLNNNSPFTLSLAPGNHSNFCLYEFEYSISYMWNHAVFAHLRLAYFTYISLQGSSMLQHVSEFPSFFRLNNITLYVHVSFSLCIHPLLETWTASIFWLLWNNAAINRSIQISVLVSAFNYFGYMFHYFQELPYIFYSKCIVLPTCYFL